VSNKPKKPQKLKPLESKSGRHGPTVLVLPPREQIAFDLKQELVSHDPNAFTSTLPAGAPADPPPRVVQRQRLSDTRKGPTRAFRIQAAPSEDNPSGVVKIYVTIGLYEDGRPGEIFIRVGKSGSLASGAFDGAAMAASVAWQYGTPCYAIASKWKAMKFEPSGFTGDEKYPIAHSVLDLVGRWLLDTFCPKEPE